MITRTFTKQDFTAIIFDEATDTTRYDSVSAFGSIKQAEKEIRKHYAKSGINLCKLIHIGEQSAVYGVSEAKFMEVAELLKTINPQMHD